MLHITALSETAVHLEDVLNLAKDHGFIAGYSYEYDPEAACFKVDIQPKIDLSDDFELFDIGDIRIRG